jgi:5-methyltetrahydrofolate--homocysteine methyltransferase
MSSKELLDAIVNLQEAESVARTKQLLEKGIDPLDILADCREGMTVIGGRFEREEAFLPELIMAGEILKSISEIIKPVMSQGPQQEILGKVVIGTVQGDIHDIAKDIVVFMLDINGFEVYDLGVDVPPQVFIDKVREVDADVLGLSGFLTLAYDPMKHTVEALRSAGLEKDIKVMIGGGQVDDYAREYTGADAWGADAMSAVRLAKAWLGEAKSYKKGE